MLTRINRVVDSLKLSKPDKDEINRLIARPEVQAIISADEGEQIAHRQALLNELAAMPGNADKLKASAEKTVAKAVKRFEVAEIEYNAAKAEQLKAQLAFNFSDYPDLTRAKQIERELTASSDPRISEYRFEIGQLVGRVRTKMQYWHGKTPKTWVGGGEPRHFSNVDDVAAARVELDNGLLVLRELELSASTNGERTQRLKALTTALKTTLAKLDMNPPTIDKYGNVVAPIKDGAHIAEDVEAA
jgi:hypothetical protein